MFFSPATNVLHSRYCLWWQNFFSDGCATWGEVKRVTGAITCRCLELNPISVIKKDPFDSLWFRHRWRRKKNKYAGNEKAQRKKEGLTWRRRWSGTSASGLWRWWRTDRGSCGWSSHSRASRTPPVDTGTWTHPTVGWHTCLRFCTHLERSGLKMHSAHSDHLKQRFCFILIYIDI